MTNHKSTLEYLLAQTDVPIHLGIYRRYGWAYVGGNNPRILLYRGLTPAAMLVVGLHEITHHAGFQEHDQAFFKHEQGLLHKAGLVAPLLPGPFPVFSGWFMEAVAATHGTALCWFHGHRWLNRLET